MPPPNLKELADCPVLVAARFSFLISSRRGEPHKAYGTAAGSVDTTVPSSRNAALYASTAFRMISTQ